METKTHTIECHDGHAVKLIWPVDKSRWRRYLERSIPPFPFPIYVLRDVAYELPNDDTFPSDFLAYFQRLVSPAFRASFHLEIYDHHFSNVLACVDHQRKEVAWRNRNGIWPRLVENWSVQNASYLGFIIVVDSRRWEEEGLVLVDFDPATEHETKVITATRCTDVNELKDAIWDRWIRAGNEWTSRDLERRNQGGFSPALYPAVDPAAHEDVEYEALDAVQQPLPRRLIDTLDDDELEVSPFHHASPDVRWQRYVDSSGQRTCTVWCSRNSVLWPPFSITFDCGTSASLPPLTIFRALNKGSLADVPWALEVKAGHKDMHVAFEEHSKQFLRRCPKRLAESRACMKMLLCKIIADRLPVELVDAIEEILLQPEMPDLSSRRHCQPHRSVLLYTNPEKSVSEGPQMIFSHPEHRCVFRTLQNATSMHRNDDARGSDDHWQPVLSVVSPRSWQGTVDRIYELYKTWETERLRASDTKTWDLQAK